MDAHYYIWRKVPQDTFVSMATTQKAIDALEASMITMTVGGPLKQPFMSVYQKNDLRTKFLNSKPVRWAFARFWGVNTSWFMFADDDIRYIPCEVSEAEFDLMDAVGLPRANPDDFRTAGNYNKTSRSTFSPDALNIDEAAKKRLEKQLRAKENLGRRLQG